MSHVGAGMKAVTPAPGESEPGVRRMVSPVRPPLGRRVSTRVAYAGAEDTPLAPAVSEFSSTL
ncbi:hypothetical protein GCM10010272_40560 [Streptomyces lateritius]|nr:hypothetical protein GCM10010272_40560 [Streptomyces lateritius]